MGSDPLLQFRAWYDQAGKETLWRRLLTHLYPPAVMRQPDAMVLASATRDGRPSARVVLFKGLKDGSFTFYTNYSSRKGRELADNPHASLVFHWDFPHRQIRIEGTVKKLPPEASAAYWGSRPRGSQVSGMASPQSSPVSGRDELVARVAQIERDFQGREIPCPEFWGGYGLSPERIEFWEGRLNRLHERSLYIRDGQSWKHEILAP